MEVPNIDVQSIASENPITRFINRSQRVLSVCTRPRRKDFEKIAKVTALGMVVIGLTGVIISWIFKFI
jgi:protein translocase SEC61 complex gamma subunit